MVRGGSDNNGSKIVYQGSLVDTGAVVSIAIDNLNIEVTRINATELGAIIRSSEILSIPTTRRATAASSVESWRKVIESSASGTVFDSITVGTYILVEYWVTYKDKKYYVVAGSDDDELRQAWIEIYEGFIL
ncbi:MAG: hypothetical protein LUE98_04570 [Tannerellaceae bacterium]|nr:hypothetical protein [Tannerellaceae bacterium]